MSSFRNHNSVPHTNPPEIIDLTTSDSEPSIAPSTSSKRQFEDSTSSAQPAKKTRTEDLPANRPTTGAQRLAVRTTNADPSDAGSGRFVDPVIQVASSSTAPRPSFLDAGALRKQVVRNLKQLRDKPVKLVNDIDDSSPPVNFRFVNDNILGSGVQRLGDDFMVGCTCHPENGRGIGCEYLYCECVQESDPNESGQLHFAYSAGKDNAGCLRDVHLRTRNHIYECNSKCNCGDNCKNRVVQKGRQVPLEIFKTTNRGWGLRCPQALQKGQFIDTYRGEVITNAESNRRGALRQENEDNYLFGLDKFCEEPTITKKEFKAQYPEQVASYKAQIKAGEYEVSVNGDGDKMWPNPGYEPPMYDIDGMNMGAPTRFINHSCQPNCAIYTVSYNHADRNLYELAFFAMQDIPANEELTFDYKDDNDTAVITEEMADQLEMENGERPTKCLCGAEACRGYFFH